MKLKVLASRAWMALASAVSALAVAAFISEVANAEGDYELWKM